MTPALAIRRRFRRTRADHAGEVAEDYTELIADLIERRGEARVVDLADALGVSHVAVSKMLRRLDVAGLVVAAPRGPITLTARGRTLAARARWRHGTVVAFLRSLGVPDAVADADAEGIEHHCSRATIAAMARALRAAQGGGRAVV